MLDDRTIAAVQKIVDIIKRLDALTDNEKLELQHLAVQMDIELVEREESRSISSILILNELGINTIGSTIFKPKVATLVNSIIYFNNSGLDFEKCMNLIQHYKHVTGHKVETLEMKRNYLDLSSENFGEIVFKHPSIVSYSIENLETKRAYLNLTLEEFRSLALKSPQAVCTSIESFETKKDHLNLQHKDFVRLVLRYPSVVGYSVENLDAKRVYLGLTNTEFGELILKQPSITGYSIENLETKRAYLNLTHVEFGRLVLKHPSIAGYSIENLETKFKFYKIRTGVTQENIISSIISGGVQICLSYSIQDRVMPRYVTYKNTLRKSGGQFNVNAFLNALWYSDGKFISKMSIADRLVERVGSSGEIELFDPYYERAKQLCKLMRKIGTTLKKQKSTE